MNEFWEQYYGYERRWGDNCPRRSFLCGSAYAFLVNFSMETSRQSTF